MPSGTGVATTPVGSPLEPAAAPAPPPALRQQFRAPSTATPLSGHTTEPPAWLHWLVAALVLPLLAVGSLGALAGVLLVLGLAVAPYMITLFSACERVVAPARLGAAMTVLAAATSLGYAVGSSSAGHLADLGGYPAAYRVPVIAGVSALVLSLVLRRALHRAPSRASSSACVT